MVMCIVMFVLAILCLGLCIVISDPTPLIGDGAFLVAAGLFYVAVISFPFYVAVISKTVDTEQEIIRPRIVSKEDGETHWKAVNEAGEKHSAISNDKGVYLADETNIVAIYKREMNRNGVLLRTTWEIGLTLHGWCDTVEANGETQ